MLSFLCVKVDHMTMSILKLAAVLAVTAMGFGTAASASTVQLTAQNPSHPLDFANGDTGWWKTGKIHFDGRSEHVYVNMNNFYENDGGTQTAISAFCIEVRAWANIPNLFEKTVAPANTLADTVSKNLSKLYTMAFSQVTNSSTAAAFQLAVWEIATETSGSFAIGSGSFWATLDGNNSATVALANSWLGQLGNASASTDLVFYRNARAQDYVSMSPVSAVPLPAGAVLLIGALGGLGALRRRKAVK